MLTPPERMSATLRADLRTSPFGLGSCSHMHSAPPENDFSRAFGRNARGGRERIEKRPAKNCGAKSNSHELLRVHTTYLAGEEIKITIPSLENRFFLFFSPTGNRRNFSNNRRFRRASGENRDGFSPVRTIFPCGGLDVPLGVECSPESRVGATRIVDANRARSSTKIRAALLQILGFSVDPLPAARSAPGSRSFDGTRRLGDVRAWRESSTVFRPSSRTSCGFSLRALRTDRRQLLPELPVESETPLPRQPQEKRLIPNRFHIGVRRRKFPACTTRSLSPNGSNGQRLRGMSRRLSVRRRRIR